MDSSLKITKLSGLDTFVIRQRGRDVFISTKDSTIIDSAGLGIILEFLVMNNMLDTRILERILNEYDNKKT